MTAALDIGPYPLIWKIVDRALIRRSSGVILLGDMAANGRSFMPLAVKLATFDLKRELFYLVEEAEFGWFRCAYAPTSLAARRVYEQWRDALAPQYVSRRVKHTALRASAR